MRKKTKKWVIVTGANGGIGRAIVICFAQNGYSVIATDITEFKVEAPNVVNMQIDLEQIVLDENYAKDFKARVNRITDGAGITSLVNNAAIQVLGSVQTVSRSDWFKTMNINVSAAFFYDTVVLRFSNE